MDDDFWEWPWIYIDIGIVLLVLWILLVSFVMYRRRR